MNYVIIGNSTAAIGCIEGIRQIDTTGSITVISDEPYHTYSRPLISYWLKGKVGEEQMLYRDKDFYEKMNCTVLLNQSVDRIDPSAKTVILKDGQRIGYDKLLNATGSRPFVPSMAGLETVQQKFAFMTFDQAQELKAALTAKSRVLIIGAGLIGLKCAEGLSGQVAFLTVVDLAPRILSSILDEDGAQMVQRHLEENGVCFVLGESVSRFQATTAFLQSGQTIDFDVLVLAVGVRPNVELIKAAGGQVERGIIVNEHSKTTLCDIYAAGDCTQCHDIVDGSQRILAILPNAYQQGECAGINMAGGNKVFDKAIPMNSIGFFGQHLCTAGHYEGESTVMTGEGWYKRLIVADGVLKGFILIGDVARAGIYTALIREQVDLADIDFELIKEKPQLMAFSRAERAKKLGGIAR